MRVIAGELRGRRLQTPPPGKDGIRPTSDRAREALFSMLGPLDGIEVLDLWCGTGALGIEAVSRGAAAAVMVDADPALAAVNARELGIEDRCRAVRADAFTYLERAAAEGRQWGLILCDPPYKLGALIADQLEKHVPSRLAPGGRLVVEGPAADPVALSFDALGAEPVRERRYGAALIRIWEHSA